MSLVNNTSISGPPSIEISGTTATVNMGVEVSSNGSTLYFSRAVFLNAGAPSQIISASNILFAQKINGAFVYDETTANTIMQNINTNDNLEYAACISENELEFYFTRTLISSMSDLTPDSQIMRAVRRNNTEAFGLPKAINTIPNHIKFVEAPTIYGDVLYYHQFDNGVANLYKVTRQQMTLRYILLMIFTFVLLSCGESNNSPTGVSVPQAQGARILGMDVKETPSVTYATAYSEAISIGVREVSISLDWSLLEPSVGNYDNTLPSIIDSFYPTQSGDITLILRPLDSGSFPTR